MGTFFENSMLLFVDDSEPILPTFRSTEYANTGRVVELADVGCDTETTFPVHFSRDVFDRRRGGAENLGSTRRISKWLNNRPNKFTRRASDINNDDDRNGNYIRRKMRQDIRNYDDEPDADFNNLYTENSYDDFELSKNDFAAEEDNYTQFVNPQNAIARSYRERVSQYDYLRDLESPFMQSIHIPLRKKVSPQWLAESDKKNLDTDIQSGERKKRTKILSRSNRSFNRKDELEQSRDTAMYREQDNLPNVVDPVMPSKQMFWDFISFENDSECEGTTFYNPTKTKNHSGLQKMTPLRRRSYIFNSQPKRKDVVDSEEEEFNERIKKNSRENLSPKIPINSKRYGTLKGDAMKEKSKILQLNTPNANSSRGQSIRTSVDEQISNMYFTAKDSNNMRPHSATEGKRNKFLTTERREEIINTTGTTVDNRQYCDKFVNKLSNNSPKKTSHLTRMFNRIADLSNNERIKIENERDNINSHRGNTRNSKMDQIDVPISRLTPEKITQNEKTFALKMTNISVPHLDIKKKKERKFFSRLPIRTWKRLRTKEPSILRSESDATNKDKLQKVESEAAKLNNHPEKTENDDVHTKDRAITINSNDVKQSEHFGTGSLSVNKPRLTSFDLKSRQKNKDLNSTRRTYEQWKKRMNIK